MKRELKQLTDVMSVQTTSYDTKRMNKFILNFVSKVKGAKAYKKNGNIYVTKGESDNYPCVVAHTDTVHDIEKEFIVQRHKDVLYAINDKYERVGVGGDDKVGIFVALQVLVNTDNVKVAFFRDEEVGCVGSKVAHMEFFKDVGFVLQCDRKGYADFVSSIYSTKLYDSDFSSAVAPYLKEFDRVEADGGLTDVYQLAQNGLEVAVANMSCGYYEPHTELEYIKISEVFRTLDFVQALVDDLGGTRFTISTKDREVLAGGYSGYGRYSRYGGWDSFYDEPKDTKTDTKELVCTCCGTYGEIEYDDSVGMHWCYGCMDYVDSEDIEDWGASDDDTTESQVVQHDGFKEDDLWEGRTSSEDFPF